LVTPEYAHQMKRPSNPNPDQGPGCLHAGCGVIIGLMLGAAFVGTVRRMFGLDLVYVPFLVAAAVGALGAVFKGRLWRWLGL
jgi:hypothetical protein